MTEPDTRPVPSQAGAERRAVLRYSPVMTDSDKDSGNQRKPWSPEDWRLLIITFAGGLASIIVGAGALGLAVALARLYHPHNDWFTWVVFVVCPLGSLVGFVAFLLDKRDSLGNKICMYFCGSYVIFVILVWIGVAAGIK